MNVATVKSAVLVGIEAVPVTVEVSVAPGTPCFDVTGMEEASVREMRLRVRSAFRQSKFTFPTERVTVSVYPLDLRKHGNGLDLAVAVALLKATDQVPADSVNALVVGELSLSGSLRPVRGVAAMTELAFVTGVVLICPKANEMEAVSLIQSVHAADSLVFAADSLASVVSTLKHETPWTPISFSPPAPQGSGMCFTDVRGQTAAKRALEIAAAGGHNVLLVGQAGAGKTMLARRLTTVMAPIERQEAVEVTKVWSASGLLATDQGLAQDRPFRAPHYTVSAAALVGGGSTLQLGEVSLAHQGVLFLDELSEFPRHVLECLQAPLADGFVTLTRARQTVRMPARCLLVAAMPECPCGRKRSECKCSDTMRERYWGRVSPTVLTKFDLGVQMVHESPRNAAVGDTSAEIRKRVATARNAQAARFGANVTNATVPMSILREDSPLKPAVHELLLTAVDQFNMTDREHNSVWRVARTVADLAGSKDVECEHVAEALQCRTRAALHDRQPAKDAA